MAYAVPAIIDTTNNSHFFMIIAFLFIPKLTGYSAIDSAAS